MYNKQCDVSHNCTIVEKFERISNIFDKETLENFFVSALYTFCIYFLESAKLAYQLTLTQPSRVDRMEKKELVTEEKNDFTILYDYLPSIS